MLTASGALRDNDFGEWVHFGRLALGNRCSIRPSYGADEKRLARPPCDRRCVMAGLPVRPPACWRAAAGSARVEGARPFVDWDEGGEALQEEGGSLGAIRRTTKDLRSASGDAKHVLRVNADGSTG